MLYAYKPDEGRNARQSAFWLGMGMLFFGCMSLRRTLDGWQSLRVPLTQGAEIPLIGTPLNGSLVAATVVFLAGAWLWVRYLSRPSVAQHLIEVESEVRKVTWPSFKEASNSTVVVIVTVLILMGFLALSDFSLGMFFRFILWDRV